MTSYKTERYPFAKTFSPPKHEHPAKTWRLEGCLPVDATKLCVVWREHTSHTTESCESCGKHLPWAVEHLLVRCTCMAQYIGAVIDGRLGWKRMHDATVSIDVETKLFEAEKELGEKNNSLCKYANKQVVYRRALYRCAGVLGQVYHEAKNARDRLEAAESKGSNCESLAQAHCELDKCRVTREAGDSLTSRIRRMYRQETDGKSKLINSFNSMRRERDDADLRSRKAAERELAARRELSQESSRVRDLTKIHNKYMEVVEAEEKRLRARIDELQKLVKSDGLVATHCATCGRVYAQSQEDTHETCECGATELYPVSRFIRPGKEILCGDDTQVRVVGKGLAGDYAALARERDALDVKVIDAAERIAELEKQLGLKQEAHLKLTVREACRRKTPLDGADAQALEHALTMTEAERDEARALGETRRAVIDQCHQVLIDAGLDGLWTLQQLIEALVKQRDEARAECEELRGARDTWVTTAKNLGAQVDEIDKGRTSALREIQKCHELIGPRLGGPGSPLLRDAVAEMVRRYDEKTKEVEEMLCVAVDVFDECAEKAYRYEKNMRDGECVRPHKLKEYILNLGNTRDKIKNIVRLGREARMKSERKAFDAGMEDARNLAEKRVRNLIKTEPSSAGDGYLSLNIGSIWLGNSWSEQVVEMVVAHLLNAIRGTDGKSKDQD